ncbi:hypothetical protein HD806DRAFT_474892 [Xylariaceae sp. AK1471]|nr:hypothetical protein HD806DRAFT_474892 [Xylariaceae sp. AK1471]
MISHRPAPVRDRFLNSCADVLLHNTIQMEGESLPSIGGASEGQWPKRARAAICLTLDNMGEAADLTRKLWPETSPIGKHYSVTRAIPAILMLLKKYGIPITYFIETWNIDLYGDFILEEIVSAGHEMAWHAWRHEPWAKLKNEEEERANFERSFGPDGIGQWLTKGLIEPYSGFRPPGGVINGDITLNLCREFGLSYLSPAATEAAMIDVGSSGDHLVILPFKWATVDAYYYMQSFAGLRKMKGEYPEAPQSPEVLVTRFKSEIDKAVETGGFLSILFHPFLTDQDDRLDALESVLEYLSQKRANGDVWLARCKDVERFIRDHPERVGNDPQWDYSSWS